MILIIFGAQSELLSVNVIEAAVSGRRSTNPLLPHSYFSCVVLMCDVMLLWCTTTQDGSYESEPTDRRAPERAGRF